MPAKITLEKAFKEDPYQSIITLLMKFKEGLILREIMYALIEDYIPGFKWKRKSDGTRYHHYPFADKFGKEDVILNEWLKHGRIKRYEPKMHRKKGEWNKKIAVNVRNNLRNHLKRMRQRGWVYKDGMKYKLAREVFAEKQRYPHLERLQSYPNDQLYPSSSFPPEYMEKPSDYYTDIMLYGIPNEVIDKETNEIITKELNKIRKSFLRLSKLQQDNIALSVIWKQVVYPDWEKIVGKKTK